MWLLIVYALLRGCGSDLCPSGVPEPRNNCRRLRADAMGESREHLGAVSTWTNSEFGEDLEFHSAKTGRVLPRAYGE